MTNDHGDGGFDANHVMVAVSLPVLVLHAHPHALAGKADRNPPPKRRQRRRQDGID